MLKSTTREATAGVTKTPAAAPCRSAILRAKRAAYDDTPPVTRI